MDVRASETVVWPRPTVTQGTFEWISAQTTVGLHVANGWLDGGSPVNHLSQRPDDASLLPGSQDLCARDNHTLIALVDNRDLRFAIGQNAHLLQGFG